MDLVTIDISVRPGSRDLLEEPLPPHPQPLGRPNLCFGWHRRVGVSMVSISGLCSSIEPDQAHGHRGGRRANGRPMQEQAAGAGAAGRPPYQAGRSPPRLAGSTSGGITCQPRRTTPAGRAAPSLHSGKVGGGAGRGIDSDECS